MIGTTVDQFEILEEIGRGGMGVVYLARQHGLDRLVALKFLPFADRTLAGRLQREASTLAELQHPNIVPIFAVGQHNGSPYYAMAYCPGGSLADVGRNNGTLTTGQVCGLLAPVADALSALHRRGMVHRDIKPSNVLLSADSQPFVSDFGLALGPEASRSTSSGNVLGTLGYSAPELLSGGQPTAASDVFSFGVLGYELAAGRAPFVGVHVSGVLDAVRRGEFVPLAQLCPYLDPRLAEMIESCMAADPAARPADLADVANRIRALAPLEAVLPASRPESMLRTVAAAPRSRERAVSVEVQPLEPAAQQSRSRKWVWAASALLLLLGGLGLVLTRRDGTSDVDGAAADPYPITVSEVDLDTKVVDGVTANGHWAVTQDGDDEYGVAATISLTGVNSSGGVFTWYEVVPKGLVQAADAIHANTSDPLVVQPDPVLRFCFDMSAPNELTWHARLDSAIDQTTLAALAAEWSDEFDALPQLLPTLPVEVQEPCSDASSPSTSVATSTSGTGSTTPADDGGGATGTGGGDATGNDGGGNTPTGGNPTPTPVAPQPPGAITISNLTASSATASWGASLTQGVTYKVTLDNVDKGTTSATTLSFNGLQSNTKYTVKVVAVANGLQSAGQTKDFTTAPVAPQPPGAISISNLTATSAKASWGASPTPGVTYKVIFDNVDKGTISATNITFSGLRIYSPHTVKVVAIANGLSSTEKSANFTTTKGSYPVGNQPAFTGSPPSNGGACKAHAVSKGSAQYFTDADNDITTYTASNLNVTASNWKWSFNKSTGVATFTAPAGTSDGTILSFQVQATDSVGQKSNTITVKYRMTGNCN